MRKNKVLKVIGLFLLILLVIVCAYVVYVFAAYSRIADNMVLNPDVSGEVVSENIEAGKTYTAVSYNIGFGAYTSDYSFFMDGGKSSWAESPDRLNTNLIDIGSALSNIYPDIVLLQEVDTDGTRTYHVNEYEFLRDYIGEGSYIFAQNYHSSFLMYPFNEPHGANESGLVTYISDFSLESAIRRSLPISESVSKIVDLDRCYSITRIHTDNGHELAIYNVHLSAYTNDDSIRSGQINMLFEDMSADYAAGNYVICAGDYNQNLRDVQTENVPGWASRFPRESFIAGFDFAFDVASEAVIDHDTCRNADSPYDPDTAFTVMVDGFIVSDNITVTSYENLDYGYAYSDHDPVVIEFVLNE